MPMSSPQMTRMFGLSAFAIACPPWLVDVLMAVATATFCASAHHIAGASVVLVTDVEWRPSARQLDLGPTITDLTSFHWFTGELCPGRGQSRSQEAAEAGSFSHQIAA